MGTERCGPERWQPDSDLEVGNLREKLFLTYSVLVSFFVILFGTLNYLYGVRWFAPVEYLFAVGYLVNLYLYLRFRKELNVRFFTLWSLVLVTFLAVTGGFMGNGIFWYLEYPLVTFFLASLGESLFWNFLSVVILILLVALSYFGVFELAYSPFTYFEVLEAYLFGLVAIYYFKLLIEVLIGKLEERSVKDPLTGAFNRGVLFSRDWRNGNRCLIFLDLDNFKLVNDRMGHSFGDEVLKRSVEMFKRFFGSDDFIIRLGGDEFVVVARGCPDELLLKRLKELKKRFEREFEKLGLSLSFGLVKIPEEAEDIEEALKIADERMYRMKRLKKSPLRPCLRT